VRLADRIGADALTIRKIAEEIDVNPEDDELAMASAAPVASIAVLRTTQCDGRINQCQNAASPATTHLPGTAG
jgi:hypothetical protein